MKKKIAVLLVAAMSTAMAVPAFAYHPHKVIVNVPGDKAAVEEVVEEEKTEAVEATEEVEVVTEAEVVAAEAEAPAEAEEVVTEAPAEEAKPAVEPIIVISPNKETDRSVVATEGTSTTYGRTKEVKTIYNTAPSAQHPFSDLNGANEDYGRAAYALGMTAGMVTGSEFGPDSILTVEEAATWIYRLKGGEAKNGNIIAKISEAEGYAQKPLSWAAGLGLVEKSVEPKAEITVNQLKTMIDKLGCTTTVVGTDNTMSRIDGLKLILDSIYGDLSRVNTAAIHA
ncbi:hypothetical protein IMSAG049_01444 [Clostridiales bacterium]|nr:hypothetical protein IMSAG049_01444 [Clostridiales bacterium]